MTYGTTKELAERACVWLNAHPEHFVSADKPTTRYVVERYPTPYGRYPRTGAIDYLHDFGVVRKWRYADSPELAEFGGEFTHLTAKMWE